MSLLLVILIPLLGALLPVVTARLGRNVCSWSAVGVTAGALLQASTPIAQAFHGAPASANLGWMSSAGLDLALRKDGLSALFVLIVTGIGLLVIVYAHYYLAHQRVPHRPRSPASAAGQRTLRHGRHPRPGLTGSARRA